MVKIYTTGGTFDVSANQLEHITEQFDATNQEPYLGFETIDGDLVSILPDAFVGFSVGTETQEPQ
jgi:hypothetical protein